MAGQWRGFWVTLEVGEQDEVESGDGQTGEDEEEGEEAEGHGRAATRGVWVVPHAATSPDQLCYFPAKTETSGDGGEKEYGTSERYHMRAADRCLDGQVDEGQGEVTKEDQQEEGDLPAESIQNVFLERNTVQVLFVFLMLQEKVANDTEKF